MHRALNQSNTTIKKQRRYEQELERLRSKVKETERLMQQQTAFLVNMPSTIKLIEKTVLEDRNVLLKLKNVCTKLGTHIVGPNYK